MFISSNCIPLGQVTERLLWPLQEMQADMLPQVMRLLRDSDATVRAKALLALSSLLRGNSAGLDQFREQDGLHLLGRATQDPDARVRRWAVQVLSDGGPDRSLGDSTPAACAATAWDADRSVANVCPCHR